MCSQKKKKKQNCKRNKEKAKMIDFFGFVIAIWLLGWIILKWVND